MGKQIREREGTMPFRALMLAVAVCALLCLSACASQPTSSASGSAEAASSSAASSESADATEGSASAEATEGSASVEATEKDVSDQYDQALLGTGLTKNFIGEPFFERAIENDDDAYDAVESVYDRIGADDSVVLDLEAVYPTEDDTYYIFTQRVGDTRVFGAAVKLIVDKDKKAVGLVSAIMPNVEIPELESWAATQEQAEAAVSKELKEGGHDAEIISDASEQVLIPLEGLPGRYRFAWAVYTKNFLEDTDQAYLVHYVSEDGDYLYSLPVSELHDSEALSGEALTFPFDNMKQDTWTGTVTLHDGTEKELEVPVMVDPETGDAIMGDAKRKVLCADFAKHDFEDKIAPRVFDDGAMNNDELLEYATFLRIWDFYEGIGWAGPDGQQTPSLLLMDMVDENGEPIDNSYYRGRNGGWQVFAFNRITPDGENVDLMAHEFTHCVTSTTMTSILYQNDMGSINEGMSDVMGNLVEILDGGSAQGAWLIGEGAGDDRTVRSMKDPRAYRQPARVWDTYYVPSVITPSANNDQGGVHVNSSLLNIVSYKLDQAGMAPADQFYYWMNVALAMTPSTDFTQLIDLLPWCMAQSGYSEYVDAVKTAIAEVGYADREFKESMPEGAGLLEFTFPDGEAVKDGRVVIGVNDPAVEDPAITWPMADTNNVELYLPEGDYALVASVAGDDQGSEGVKCYYSDGKWVPKEDSMAIDLNNPANLIHITGGQKLVISAEGLAA